MIEHGSRSLPGVDVASYSLTLKDGAGFVGDRASGRAFFDILEELRRRIDRSRVPGPALTLWVAKRSRQAGVAATNPRKGTAGPYASGHSTAGRMSRESPPIKTPL